MNVSQKELAEILGISARRIRQLQSEEGMFSGSMEPGTRMRKYDLAKCVQQYLRFRIDGEAERHGTGDKEQEQAEHEKIKKQISLLKLQKLKRELHAAGDVEEFLTEMLVNFRHRLLAVPQKVAPLIVSEDDVNVIVEVVEQEIFQTLDELSEYDPLAIDKEKAVNNLDFDDDEEEDGTDQDDEE